MKKKKEVHAHRNNSNVLMFIRKYLDKYRDSSREHRMYYYISSIIHICRPTITLLVFFFVASHIVINWTLLSSSYLIIWSFCATACVQTAASLLGRFQASRISHKYRASTVSTERCEKWEVHSSIMSNVLARLQQVEPIIDRLITTRTHSWQMELKAANATASSSAQHHQILYN